MVLISRRSICSFFTSSTSLLVLFLFSFKHWNMITILTSWSASFTISAISHPFVLTGFSSSLSASLPASWYIRWFIVEDALGEFYVVECLDFVGFL